ncbi:YlmC/YmxH family sporulation protein [Chakrabartyella piscis]|uniref:YlmC/YmxH family sporulation protein n=1 Tax=Chakrabartyella piscis TaxID=2918914 RepID=UPI002958A793|nr:YlmC/YmxH family sporulation protein [Chakrabartyella piscis]
MERFSWLAEKEVVNICDGRRLGFVCDLEFDLSSGCICALLVPDCTCKWNVFTKSQQYRIPWSCIKQIGDDIILIEVTSTEILLVE